MAAGIDANPGRRAARWVAPVGLCGGAVCLLAGAAVYLGAELDRLPATWTQEELPTAVRSLVQAAVVVLGTVLTAVGSVFALLGRTGLPAVATGLRHGAQAPEPDHDRPAPASAAPVPGPGATDLPAPAPDHGTGPMGTRDAPPGAPPPRGAAPDDLADARTAPAPGPGMLGAEPIGGDEPSPARTAEPASEGAAGPDFDEPSPEPRAPANETAALPLAVEEPPPREPPQPGDLIDAWDEYRRNGDGHFSPRGLQDVLDHWGLDADVGRGDRVGADGAVLVVETFGTPSFYVLPSFNKSPRAVAKWFDDNSGGALTGRTQRVARVAQGRWLEPGTGIGRRFEVSGRGAVA